MRGVIPDGSKLRDLRRSAGWTQEQLASLAECDVKTLRAAEQSRRVDLSTLTQLAARLGLSSRELLREPGSSEVPAEAAIAAVQQFHLAFGSRDPEAVADCFLPDGIVTTMAHPGLPGAGEFRGRTRIHEWASTCFEAYRTDPVTEENSELSVAGDRVFVRLKQPRVQHRASRNEARITLMSEFRIDGGAIASLLICPHSGAMEELVFGEWPAKKKRRVKGKSPPK
jgi:transcriptional regulator with XRE-family HTH domain